MDRRTEPEKRQQLLLPIDCPVKSTFSNFLTAPQNGDAVQYLESLNNMTDQPRQVFLWGQRGVGKTHLLQAVCNETTQRGDRTTWLSISQSLAHGQEILTGLENIPVVCLDDVDGIGNDHHWQLALFRLINKFRDQGGLLLMSSRLSPHAMDFFMRDLMSRLLWGVVYQLKPLGDDQLMRVMKQYAEKRNYELSDQAIRYLIRSLPRDLTTMTNILTRLGQVSRAEHCKITVPLIKQLLTL